MVMQSPQLNIRRIVVTGELSLDLRFENGVNVIHAVSQAGDTKFTNKAGKTALVELIQYGLGRQIDSREKFHFKPILNKLDTLWLEIQANENIYTIERSLQKISAKAYVRDVEYFLNIKNIPSEPYSINEMSSFMMKVLGIPEQSVKTKDGNLSPLSFPLLMRAFILHQEHSFGAILDKVQPEQRKKDIVGFLTNITPKEKYALEKRLGEIQKKVQELDDYAESVKRYLITRNVPTLLKAENVVREISAKLDNAKQEQLRLQKTIKESYENKKTPNGIIRDISKRLLEIKHDLTLLERTSFGFQEEEERLSKLSASLKTDRTKARRVQVSSTILSSVEFSTCPRCLLEITHEMKQREQTARCMLCNRPLRTTSDAPPVAVPKTNDIELQIDEVETLLSDLKKEKEDVDKKIQALKSQEEKLSVQLDQESDAYVSPAIDYMRSQAQIIAQLETELTQAHLDLEQALDLQNIVSSLDETRQEQEKLERELRQIDAPIQSRIKKFEKIYEEILHQVNFPDLRTVNIDARTLMPFINGSLYVHTGRAYKGLATTCYHLALLQLAREEETFFPKFLVIDSPAVGDLNRNSEEKLLEYVSSLDKGSEDVDMQIILTTRHIVKSLEDNVRYEISGVPGQMLLR